MTNRKCMISMISCGACLLMILFISFVTRIDPEWRSLNHGSRTQQSHAISLKPTPTSSGRPERNDQIISEKFAALLSPYAVTPGGGERYLLETLKVYQSFGYFVHLITDERTACNDFSCIKKTSEKLHISLNFDRVNVFPENLHDFMKNVDRSKYDVFFLLGKREISHI